MITPAEFAALRVKPELEVFTEAAERDFAKLWRFHMRRHEASKPVEKWPVFAGAWKAWAAAAAGFVGPALVEVLSTAIPDLQAGRPIDVAWLGMLGRSLAISLLVGFVTYMKRQGEPKP